MNDIITSLSNVCSFVWEYNLGMPQCLSSIRWLVVYWMDLEKVSKLGICLFHSSTIRTLKYFSSLRGIATCRGVCRIVWMITRWIDQRGLRNALWLEIFCCWLQPSVMIWPLQLVARKCIIKSIWLSIVRLSVVQKLQQETIGWQLK